MLEALISKSAHYDEFKHDRSVRSNWINFDHEGQMETGSFKKKLSPTDWTLRQLFSKLGPTVFGRGSYKMLPFDYLKSIPKDLFAENINRHLSATNKEWLIRGYGDEARAVLDGKYPRIYNTKIMRAVDDLLEQEKGKFPQLRIVRPHVTADDLNLKVIWLDVDSENYGLGFYLGNGEIGNRKLRLMPAIQRISCDNSIIADEDNGIALVHRGNVHSMMIQFKAAIMGVLQSSAEMVDRMIAAEEEELPQLTDIIQDLAEKHGWSEDVKSQVLIGTEGQKTRAGLVSGITFAAHTIVDDGNDQSDMEILGGQLLYKEKV